MMKKQGRRRRAISDDGTSSNKSDDTSSDVEGNSSADEGNEIIQKSEKEENLNVETLTIASNIVDTQNEQNNESSSNISTSAVIEKSGIIDGSPGVTGINVEVTESSNVKTEEVKTKVVEKKRDNQSKTSNKGKQRSPRKDPSFVPTSGQFFLHDDREHSEGEAKDGKESSKTSSMKSNEIRESKNLGEPIRPTRQSQGPNQSKGKKPDDDKWKHDKFDQLQQSMEPPRRAAPRHRPNPHRNNNNTNPPNRGPPSLNPKAPEFQPILPTVPSPSQPSSSRRSTVGVDLGDGTVWFTDLPQFAPPQSPISSPPPGFSPYHLTNNYLPTHSPNPNPNYAQHSRNPFTPTNAATTTTANTAASSATSRHSSAPPTPMTSLDSRAAAFTPSQPPSF